MAMSWQKRKQLIISLARKIHRHYGGQEDDDFREWLREILLKDQKVVLQALEDMKSYCKGVR